MERGEGSLWKSSERSNERKWKELQSLTDFSPFQSSFSELFILQSRAVLPLIHCLSRRFLTSSHTNNSYYRSRMVDQATLDKLEAGFKKLQDASDCKSLLKKYLTREVLDACKDKKTAMGATLLDVIQSGESL